MTEADGRRYALALVGMARPDQLALVAVVYALGVLVALAFAYVGVAACAW